MVCTQNSKAVLDVYLYVAIGVNSNLIPDRRLDRFVSGNFFVVT